MRVSVDLTRAKQKMSQKSVDRGRYALANQALGDMTPLIPKDENILRGKGHINNDATEAIWDMPYAAKMFYMYMYNYTTPGTGPRWDLKAKSQHMSDWERAFMKGADW